MRRGLRRGQAEEVRQVEETQEAISLMQGARRMEARRRRRTQSRIKIPPVLQPAGAATGVSGSSSTLVAL
jgi:hypothetical protein